MKRRRAVAGDREVERIAAWTSVLKTTVPAAEANGTTMFEVARRAAEISFSDDIVLGLWALSRCVP